MTLQKETRKPSIKEICLNIVKLDEIKRLAKENVGICFFAQRVLVFLSKN